MELLHEKTFDAESTEGKIVEVLKTVYDPEIPVDIFSMGLIYEIEISDSQDVQVTMTLTSPACPVAGTLPPEVEHKIKGQVEEVNAATVEVVWDPPWTTDMMSEGAKLELGMM
jgi:FeS assembly SUF system protein